MLGGKAMLPARNDNCAAGRRIADEIYSLTGEKGVFSTRIAYVVKSVASSCCRSPMPTGRRLPR